MNPVSEDFPDSPGPGGHRLCIEDIGRRPEFYRKFFDFLFIHSFVPRSALIAAPAGETPEWALSRSVPPAAFPCREP